ncbi:MAG TPA: hypothetical protein V6D29_25930 [Leptolyngbyaceae cyanobacterium]
MTGPVSPSPRSWDDVYSKGSSLVHLWLNSSLATNLTAPVAGQWDYETEIELQSPSPGLPVGTLTVNLDTASVSDYPIAIATQRTIVDYLWQQVREGQDFVNEAKFEISAAVASDENLRNDWMRNAAKFKWEKAHKSLILAQQNLKDAWSELNAARTLLEQLRLELQVKLADQPRSNVIEFPSQEAA